jgi:hypothetical protein
MALLVACTHGAASARPVDATDVRLTDSGRTLTVPVGSTIVLNLGAAFLDSAKSFATPRVLREVNLASDLFGGSLRFRAVGPGRGEIRVLKCGTTNQGGLLVPVCPSGDDSGSNRFVLHVVVTSAS